MSVNWRGVRTDRRTRKMLNEAAKRTKPYLRPVQGSYTERVSASAGTHAGGGAVDIDVPVDSMNGVLKVLREVGFAAWHRRPEQGPWGHHIHAIAIGCSDLSPAAARQVDAYRDGRNGLADNGPDDGPKVKFTKWEKYNGTDTSSRYEPYVRGAVPGNRWVAKWDDRKWSAGDDVKELQRILNAWYPNEKRLLEDGLYGPKTERRVKFMQKRADITVDGITGPETWGTLGVT